MNDIETKSPLEDPQVLLGICQYFDSKDKHNDVMKIYEQSMPIPQLDSVKTDFLRLAAVSGFYSDLDYYKKLGKEASEQLMSSRKVSATDRDFARRNGTWYNNLIKDLIPSAILKKIEFNCPVGYRSTTPSITSHGGKIWMLQRSINLHDENYNFVDPDAIWWCTKNYILQLDNDLNVVYSEEIKPPADMQLPVRGFEDARLFFLGNELWCSCSSLDFNENGVSQMLTTRIDGIGTGDCRFTNYQVMKPNFGYGQVEKNWMPFVENNLPYFIYNCDPVIIVDNNGHLIDSRATHIAAESYRGGTQLLEFDDGYLALIHESLDMDWGVRRYMHRFVWFNRSLQLTKYSNYFSIDEITLEVSVEFAAGITVHPITDKLLISFGKNELETWIVTVDPDDVRNVLKPAGLACERLPFDAETLKLLEYETNRALKDTATVEKFTNLLKKYNLPLHVTPQKNWDNLIAIYHTVLTTDVDTPIMDIAGTADSAYLPSLYKFGYRDLTSINLSEHEPVLKDGVVYQYGDCTNTGFPDEYFGFISCLSVIEHGVDIDGFFRESHRILKKKGRLFVSTDYWQHPVNTFGKMAYWNPVVIFDAAGISDMVAKAEAHGFELTGPADLTCYDKAVHWDEMDYTFINLLFSKR